MPTENKDEKKPEPVKIPQQSNPIAGGSKSEDTEREEEFTKNDSNTGNLHAENDEPSNFDSNNAEEKPEFAENYSSSKNVTAEDDEFSGSSDVDANDESYAPSVSTDERTEDDNDEQMLLDEDGEVDTLDSEDKSVLSLARQQKQNENGDDTSDTSDSNESLMAYRPDQDIDDVNGQFQGIVSGNVKKKLPSFTEVCSELLLGLDFIIMLTMIQQSDSCLLCQPMVNTQCLGIKQIDDERFINAMIGESGDIAEDMHAILYEVTDEESLETVTIYPTYVSDEKSIDLVPLEGNFTKYPTRESLLKMAKILGLTDIDTAALDLVCEIFTHLCRGRSSEISHEMFTQQINYRNTEKEIKCSPIHITKIFLTLRNNLQSKHNIRIALLNGLHRSGLALHILGNYKIKNAKPNQSQKSLYQFTENSMINTMIGFHIFQADRQTYT